MLLGVATAAAGLGGPEPGWGRSALATALYRPAFPAPDGLHSANRADGKGTHLRMSSLFVRIADDVIHE